MHSWTRWFQRARQSDSDGCNNAKPKSGCLEGQFNTSKRSNVLVREKIGTI